MDNNYFFVDGSAFLSDVRKTRSDIGLPPSARLIIRSFVYFFTGTRFHQFHGGSYRRFVFYFVKNDERLRSTIELPDFTYPGVVSDIRIEYCGKRIHQYAQARTWLEEHSAPDYVQECLYRSEKAVDTQICCDALQLAANGKLDRLFLYTNDYDFVPLCQTLRQLGANINLFRLLGDGVNKSLVSECDAFHAMHQSEVREYFTTEANPANPPEVGMSKNGLG